MFGKLLLDYFKENKKIYIFMIVWGVMYVALFFLTGVPLGKIWYPTFISFAIYFVYMIVDIVKFAKKHLELIRFRECIDIMVDELTVPKTVIANDYYILLKEMIDRKNKYIDEIKNSNQDMIEYVTLWTHQVKTPLTALQLVAQELPEATKTECLTKLFEIEQYADMMLQYLRMESSSTDYVLKAYSVKSMVNQAVKYFARIFISKGIKVNVNIPDDYMVVTDEKWLVFVLKQLISNALKYTNKGSINIYIENKLLVIADTGIGIAKEDLPRVFEKGYTGYNGRKDKKATGLGLFLTNAILKKLNHTITITSKVNEGTTVMLGFSDK